MILSHASYRPDQSPNYITVVNGDGVLFLK